MFSQSEVIKINRTEGSFNISASCGKEFQVKELLKVTESTPSLTKMRSEIPGKPNLKLDLPGEDEFKSANKHSLDSNNAVKVSINVNLSQNSSIHSVQNRYA